MKSIKKIIASMLLGVMVIGAGVQLPASAMLDEQKFSQVQSDDESKKVFKNDINNSSGEAILERMKKTLEETRGTLPVGTSISLSESFYNQAGKAFEKEGNIAKANECFGEAKRIRATFKRLVYMKSPFRRKECLEVMKEAAQFFEQASQAYRNDGNDLKANECYEKALKAHDFIKETAEYIERRTDNIPDQK